MDFKDFKTSQGPGKIIDNTANFGKGDKKAQIEEMTQTAKDLLCAEKIPDPPDYSKINIQMRGERMLIQQFPHAEKIGSIFTPQNLEIPLDKGRVVGVGPDVKKIKVGQVIFKAAGLGQQLKDSQGNTYIFLPENAAIAVDLNFEMENPPQEPEEPLHGDDGVDVPIGAPV